MAREETTADSTQPKVLIEYQGEAEGTVTVNGRDYRLSTGTTTRLLEVAQEDVEGLMERGKFKVLSDWYKSPTAAKADAGKEATARKAEHNA